MTFKRRSFVGNFLVGVFVTLNLLSSVKSKSCVVNEFSGIQKTSGLTFGGDGGSATSADFQYPHGIWMTTTSDALLIADTDNGRIRKVDMTSRIIDTMAGGGATSGAIGNGGPATDGSVTLSPWQMCGDSTGIVYVVDRSNGVVRKIGTDSIISEFAGVVGSPWDGTDAPSGDGGQATAAVFNFLMDCVVDSNADVYISAIDNNVVRKVTKTSGVVDLYMGNAATSAVMVSGALTSSSIIRPADMFIDSVGNFFVSESDTGRVYKVAQGTTDKTLVAGFIGANSNVFSGDGGSATSAGFSGLWKSISFDLMGGMYVAGMDQHKIRFVDPATTIVTTIAGDVGGAQGFSGNGGPATSAQLWMVDDVVADGLNVYFVEKLNNVVRMLTCDATVAPSATPSQIPTPQPSATPTLTPSAVPTTTAVPTRTLRPSNTPRPTRNPTSKAPAVSGVPTAAPTVKKTTIMFKIDMELRNISDSTLNSTAQTAVCAAVVETMGLTPVTLSDMCVVLSQSVVTTPAVRRRRLASEVFEIKTVVQITANTHDLVATAKDLTPIRLYSFTTTAFTTAVNDQTFSQTLRDQSAVNGAAATLWVGDVIAAVGAYVVVVPGDTYKDGDDLSAGYYAGVVIGVLVVFFLLLLLLWWMCGYGCGGDEDRADRSVKLHALKNSNKDAQNSTFEEKDIEIVHIHFQDHEESDILQQDEEEYYSLQQNYPKRLSTFAQAAQDYSQQRQIKQNTTSVVTTTTVTKEEVNYNSKSAQQQEQSSIDQTVAGSATMTYTHTTPINNNNSNSGNNSNNNLNNDFNGAVDTSNTSFPTPKSAIKKNSFIQNNSFIQHDLATHNSNNNLKDLHNNSSNENMLTKRNLASPVHSHKSFTQNSRTNSNTGNLSHNSSVHSNTEFVNLAAPLNNNRSRNNSGTDFANHTNNNNNNNSNNNIDHHLHSPVHAHHHGDTTPHNNARTQQHRPVAVRPVTGSPYTSRYGHDSFTLEDGIAPAGIPSPHAGGLQRQPTVAANIQIPTVVMTTENYYHIQSRENMN